ncbi:alpha-hydroxy acid oxidase [Lentibacter sp.]|uniref:alpha-hydroxy acid oxidase n=1 Tax=Lentibacter sp. TaxID=2024994 RepID=UPI003F6A140B
MDLHSTYPGLEDLRRRARARIPHFVFEYLDSGTGREITTARNRTALDAIRFTPSVLHGPQTPDLSRALLGADYALPFGVAPVGMSGLIWPDAERLLAAEAARAGLPYCLSTVAAQTPEYVAPALDDKAWFQLYPPKDEAVLKDILARARAAGFHALVLTLDVPVASRRERQTRSGLTQPPKFGPRLLWQTAQRPAWALRMLQSGAPRMRTLDAYIKDDRTLPPTAHIGYLLRTSPDISYLKRVRALWDGPLVVKGIMDPASVPLLQDEGVDGLWVSNHAGRQFDAAPASIEALPAIRAASNLPIIFDSGIGGGLDILRALALGADFVMLGRAWHYALAALGAKGPQHLTEMLTQDLIANLGQIGVDDLKDLPKRLIPPRAPAL